MELGLSVIKGADRWMFPMVALVHFLAYLVLDCQVIQLCCSESLPQFLSTNLKAAVGDTGVAVVKPVWAVCSAHHSRLTPQRWILLCVWNLLPRGVQED